MEAPANSPHERIATNSAICRILRNHSRGLPRLIHLGTEHLHSFTPFPTPEPHRRRTGSHPPPDTARSPPSPPRGSPATLPPALVPASAGMELTRRTRIRKLLQRLPARSSADFEWTPAPREIRRRPAIPREILRPRIEKDRPIPVEAWDPKRQSRRERRASTRGAVPPALVGHR